MAKDEISVASRTGHACSWRICDEIVIITVVGTWRPRQMRDAECGSGGGGGGFSQTFAQEQQPSSTRRPLRHLSTLQPCGSIASSAKAPCFSIYTRREPRHSTLKSYDLDVSISAPLRFPHTPYRMATLRAGFRGPWRRGGRDDLLKDRQARQLRSCSSSRVTATGSQRHCT